MATDPEALTQLSRLVGESFSPTATPVEVQRILEQRLDSLTDGIVAEAASSDDVFDRPSAIEFVTARVDDLAKWLSEAQRARLLDAAQGKIDTW
ncbi:MAG TPA: hypothetical protein VFS30_00235 [Dehalococcoidia bacterium]|nr:hypothetical protein [Dehalococcoidia bacterium]